MQRLALMACAASLGGCATQAIFPTLRFNGPDTRGFVAAPPAEGQPPPPAPPAQPPWEDPPIIGRILPVAITGGDTLIPFQNGGATVEAGNTPVGAQLQVDHPFRDDFDVGIVLQPQAPLIFRVRKQVAGPPQSRPEAKVFLGTLTGSLGFGFSSMDVGTSTTVDQLTLTSLLIDVSFAGGIRLGKTGTYYLEPFLRFDSLSASQTSVGSASGSAFELGSILGARWELDQLLIFLEVAYTRAGSAENLVPGLALGFRL
ncbi:MAG TPA: hypothetical protein VL588_02975 [Bdellovibrionota bacterium]|nr:hypothetical protein [Bdellovibrionota bacterium]